MKEVFFLLQTFSGRVKVESDREEAKGKDLKPLSFGGLLYMLMWLTCLIPLSFRLGFREAPAPSLGHPGPPLPGYHSLLLRLSVLPLGGVGPREGAQREAIPKTDEEGGIQLLQEHGQGDTVLRMGQFSPSLPGCSQILLQSACTGSTAEA